MMVMGEMVNEMGWGADDENEQEHEIISLYVLHKRN